MAKKMIGINVTEKDAKKIVELAGLLAQIFTPTEETPIAVITEAAPAPKKAAKKATKKEAEKPAKAAKATKKETKKSKLKKITVGSLHRITLPHDYLDATGARGGMVDVLRKYGKTSAVYIIPAGNSYNTKKYGKVKTVNFNRFGTVAVGRLLKGVEQGDEVRVDLRGDKIIIRK
jgi:hypothetical protein